MLSDSESKKAKDSTPNRSMYAKTNKQWSDDQRMEAIQSYLLLGNLALTARILGIPEVTLRVWKASDWWKERTHEIKTQERIQLSSRMKKIVEASLTVVEDRLLNGDYQFDQKTGQTIRKPVNMKDAHKVAIDLQDRQELVEKASTAEILIKDESVESKLMSLAEKFAELATKKIDQKVNEHRTVEAEDVSIKEE